MTIDNIVQNVILIRDDDQYIGFRLADPEPKILLHGGFQVICVDSFENFKLVNSELLFDRMVQSHNDILYKAINTGAISSEYKEKMLDSMIFPRIPYSDESVQIIPE